MAGRPIPFTDLANLTRQLAELGVEGYRIMGCVDSTDSFWRRPPTIAVGSGQPISLRPGRRGRRRGLAGMRLHFTIDCINHPPDGRRRHRLYTWIYVQEGDVRVGRVQVFNNWSPYMVADPDSTVWIGLEYFVDEGDDLWAMDDADLVRLGTAEMEKIGFLRGEDVLDGCVLRMPKAYPAYFGTFDRMDEIQEWSKCISNLFLVGRNGMHRYNNQDHSMLTAMVAVDGIEKEAVQDVWGVNVEMAYHEEVEA